MPMLTMIRAALFLLVGAGACFGQRTNDGLVDATKAWLKNVSAGAKSELLAATDEGFLATTPAGEVVVREQLIPTDADLPVQRLPAMALDGPLARVVGETGVVMSRLRPAEGQVLNATFVFVRLQGAWKLTAIHFSTAGR
jgi:hypothetical protein